MIQTEVLIAGPTPFDSTGRALSPRLTVTDESISQGLAKRLSDYAHRQLDEHGFGSLAGISDVSVYTVDGNDRPSERSYCVRWTNAKGGYIELVGIATKAGWPFLDFGFAFGFDSGRVKQ